MRSYVVLLRPAGAADGPAGERDYSARRDMLAAAARAVVSVAPEARAVHANRRSVEFLIDLHDPAAELARLRAVLESGIGPAVFAAAPVPPGGLDEEAVVQLERQLSGARPSGQALRVSDSEPRLDEVAAAIDADQFVLHYQPKLRARGGGIAGAEALIRWQHPRLGLLMPDRFIPMVEAGGDIAGLTHWVIARAAADRAALAADGWAMPVHVNISAPLICDRGFVAAALERLAGQEGGIGFEITESAMIADPEGALASLERIAAAGIRLSIDDYGTGFSSLAYLQRMPVHELKIDRRFVSTLTRSARDPLLVRSTIELAHALEMEVTAEGVENAAALALLQVMRCDLMQGYFLSPPLPLAEFAAFARATAEGAVSRPAAASLRERLANRRARGGDVA